MFLLRFLWMFTCAVFTFSSCDKKVKNKEDNDIDKEVSYEGIFQADPTIFYHEGIYYLYGTNDRDPNQGFQVYTSNDMKIWKGPVGEKEGYALSKHDVFGDVGFWAPQVWYEKGVFYMAYTADENIAIATSNSPLGPFTQKVKKPITAGIKQIDPFVFQDSDAKKYLFHVRLQEGNRIFVAELEKDYSAIKEETLKECIVASSSWENEAQSGWPVAEGATVVFRDDKYYMFYSANDFRNPKYAVGIAVSDNVTGPWQKIGNGPVLSIHNTNWSGSGHGDLFTTADGKQYYVFHTHYAKNQATPRRTAIVPVYSKYNDQGILNYQFEGKEIFHIKVEK